MVYLTFACEFNAFHKMWNSALSEEQNLATFGKCANPAGHGHRYRLEITVKGKVTREAPFVLKETEIKKIKDEVLAPRFDCADLNEVFGKDFISSGENLAREIWRLLQAVFTDRPALDSVKVIETRKNSFVYSGRRVSCE